jgi:hypothetical protein
MSQQVEVKCVCGWRGARHRNLYKSCPRCRKSTVSVAPSREIDVPIPQAFRDLVTLAAGLEEFQSDPRMSAVLEACEALVGGAEASPVPAEPDPWQATIDALQARHGGPDGEHHFFQREHWQDEVGNGDTQRGYWDWVAAQIEQHGDDPCSDGDPEESTCEVVKAAYAAEEGGGNA